MDSNDQSVSHVDLYHKLGKLEGLMETMMASVSTFQLAIKDVHSRIDALEKRQTELENKRSSQNGAMSALAVLGKDFAIPILAVVVTWSVAKSTSPPPDALPQILEQTPHHYRLEK
jgi:hypothetical protein